MCLDKINGCGNRIVVGSFLLGLGLFGGGVIAGIAGWNSLCLGMVFSGIGLGAVGKCLGSTLRCRAAPTENPKATQVALIAIQS